MPRNSPRPTGGRRKRLGFGNVDVTRLPVLQPDDLSGAERQVWERLAPGALRMRTLTPETAEGFRLLVQTVVARNEAAAVLERDGLVVNCTVHKVSTHLRQLTQRVESLMGRYLLVAAGRAVERPREPDDHDDNPWLARDTRLSGSRPASLQHDFYGERSGAPPAAPVRRRRARAN